MPRSFIALKVRGWSSPSTRRIVAADVLVQRGYRLVAAGRLLRRDRPCHLLGGGRAGFLDPGQIFYFIIAGQNGMVEGSYGQDSTGIEEPEATLPVVCDRPQFLGGICF
ncbi:MAG: hypothetical protein ACREAA_09995 [Candidatus Polarisedimenticolia bacterium]